MGRYQSTWTIEEDEALKRLFAEGLSLYQIAPLLHRRYRTVQDHAKALGLHVLQRNRAAALEGKTLTYPPRWTEEQRAKALERYLAGDNDPDICAAVGSSIPTVFYWRKENGLASNPQKYGRKPPVRRPRLPKPQEPPEPKKRTQADFLADIAAARDAGVSYGRYINMRREGLL